MLNLAGILPAQRLASWWLPMVIGIFVFAGVAAPSQDPITMSALAVPMCLLYWLSVLVARAIDRRRATRRAEADRSLAEDLGVDLGALNIRDAGSYADVL